MTHAAEITARPAAARLPAAPALPPLGANNFDFLRFLFATLVILSHSVVLVKVLPNPPYGNREDYTKEPLWWFTSGQTSLGAFSVACFFIISGFLITHSLLRSRGIWDYLKKRILRIYPGFIVANLLCLFLIVPLVTQPWHSAFSLKHIVRTLGASLALHSVSYPGAFADNPFHQVINGTPVGHINGSMWTIPFEFWCYIALGILAVVGVARSLKVTAILFALSYAWFMFVNHQAIGQYHAHWPEWTLQVGNHFFNTRYYAERYLGDLATWPKFLLFFLGGALFYHARPYIKLSGVAAIAVAVCLYASSLVPWGLVATMPLGLPYLIFYLAFTPRLPLQKWARFGDFSYGIYLYAFPIQQTIIWYYEHHRHKHINPYTLFFYSTVLSITAGALSWHLVEKWFLRLKGRAPRAH